MQKGTTRGHLAYNPRRTDAYNRYQFPSQKDHRAAGKARRRADKQVIHESRDS